MFSTNLIKLELRNFLSGRAAVAALLCLLVAGAYGIFHGRGVIEKQKAMIAQIPALQSEHTAKQIGLNSEDLGNLLYYHQFSTIHRPSSWSGFSVGQRDVNPFNVKVRMLSLEGQLYDSEMSNPTNLLYGNFDAAFVLVFLFPLVIIAFCHNLISSDQEKGLWNLLRSQPVSVMKIVGLRLVLRFAVLIALAVALITAGAILLGSAFDLRFFYANFVAVAYLTFWFALAAFVVTLEKSSTFNALTLLGIWILLTILAPALLNLVISTSLPVSESFDVTVKQREGYHRKWDRPKAETMRLFYEKYPEFSSFAIPEDKFSWGWYYAMQNAGDAESTDATTSYMNKLRTRDERTRQAAVFLPSVSAQLSFNALSRNDLAGHLDYLASVRDFHEKIRTTFYPGIFRGEKVDENLVRSVKIHEFDDETAAPEFPVGAVFITIWTAIFLLLTRFRMMRGGLSS